jgi:hypothetical protein
MTPQTAGCVVSNMVLCVVVKMAFFVAFLMVSETTSRLKAGGSRPKGRGGRRASWV